MIKHGARIGDLGGEAIRDGHHRGRPEYEVALARHRSHGPRDRPDLPGRRTPRHLGVVPVRHQHRRRPQLGHHAARSRRGDILSLNCFPMISGYYTALERTLFFGEPDAALPANCGTSTSRSTSRGLRADQARRRLQGHRRRAERDLRRPRTARQPHLRLRALLRRAVATTTAAKPAWNCARTSTPCSSPAWSSPWSR